ncbi:unnamed protein product [Mesocestoides corti]|uniref:IRS-type PTB domain-containing protein n=1 Tax=Mesocestoides corti TaxID=53468 RepID=A0A158QV09_MESCO|nr:unnamed protein product [Mesocestoides corti]
MFEQNCLLNEIIAALSKNHQRPLDYGYRLYFAETPGTIRRTNRGCVSLWKENLEGVWVTLSEVSRARQTHSATFGTSTNMESNSSIGLTNQRDSRAPNILYNRAAVPPAGQRSNFFGACARAPPTTDRTQALTPLQSTDPEAQKLDTFLADVVPPTGPRIAFDGVAA